MAINSNLVAARTDFVPGSTAQNAALLRMTSEVNYGEAGSSFETYPATRDSYPAPRFEALEESAGRSRLRDGVAARTPAGRQYDASPLVALYN
jgi:hypothetical protein